MKKHIPVYSNSLRVMITKTSKFLLSAAFCFMLAAPMARAMPIVDVTDDATYSYTWGVPWTLGYSFTTANRLTFNALGVFDPISAIPGTSLSPASTVHINAAGLNSSHQVTIWDSVGTPIISAMVDPGDPTTASANSYGNWVYQSVPSTTLQPGTYTIGSLFLANSDPVMVQQTAFANVPGVTYNGGRYNPGGTLAFPTGSYPPNEQQYFGPTLLSVPDGGTTATLLLVGIAGLFGIRRHLGSGRN